MADIQSNIKVNIDTTEALASIKNLQRQISAFHTSMAKGGAAANAVTAQMQQSLINSINATGKFSAQMKTIKTTTESFTNSLEKNKFTLGEYFRYAGGASKTFGKLFKTEFNTINKVARENVKDLQTQYIKMGRDANGAMKAIAVRPLSLDMNNLATKTMIASEKQAILNQLLKQGSTNLLNFGKNTQWAGRQLMVGFTIPLIAVGSQAAKTFMTMETQAIRFKKVYGDLFTPQAESIAALDSIKNLGKEFTKYGVAVSATVGLAADAAAAGFKGVDLQNQTTAATRLAILGQIDNQQALETTIALQNAFSISSADLADNINFLNAVENQTVLSLDDVTIAIPKAAPVIKQLGGNVKDLAFFLTAMKQGGINASEGANALKSGLASMINPTSKASAMLKGFGINITDIVENNRGNLKKTVLDFATALNQLDPLNRAQAIEQMFGKFQFARLSTLFANVTKEGSQAARVLDLAGASVQDLAGLSEKELGITADSAMNKFKASIENLKLVLVPLGEQFLKVVTPVAEFVTKVLEKFNGLSDGAKKIIVTLTAIVAGLGPVLLMTFGLLANGVANIIKGFVAVKSIFNKTGQSSATLGTEVKYMTLEQRNAAAVAASLDQVHKTLAQTFTAETNSVNLLTAAYQRSIAAQRGFIPAVIPMGRGPVTKRAKGKPSVVGGTGNKDTELALLTPGETVIPKEMSKKYGSLINGMIAGNIPGYIDGLEADSESSAYWTKTKRDELLDSLNLSDTERIRIPIAGDTPSYSTSGVMAPASVNDTPAGMTREFIQSPVGRAAYNENIRIGLEDIGTSSTRISEIFDEVGPTLKDAIDNFDDTSGEWSKTTQKAMDKINKSPNLSEAEKVALRKRISPTNPEDYTVGSKKVLDVSRRRAVPRAERINAPARYGSARMLRRLKKQFPDENFSKYEYSHMPGQASISGQQADIAEPTIGSGTRGVKGRALTAKELEIAKKAGKEFEAVGKKDAKGYNDGVASASSPKNDPALRNRSKERSAHPQVIKDGTDDGKAYSTAVQKSIDRQNKKLAKQGKPPIGSSQSGKSKGRRQATRPQGPALIGPIIPAGTKELNIIPQLTAEEKRKESKRQTKTKLLGGMKTAGSKLGTRLGGGTALLGANMALSAMPDFAGKGLIQSTMTGANMGMLFGPWGAAAGAAIGLVSSALGSLIAKEKEHKAVAEATFKASADVAKFFGNTAAASLTPISNFAQEIISTSKNAKDAQTSLGLTAVEISNFTQMVQSLPADNPLATIVKGISNESNPAKIKETAQSFVQMQVALGQIKPEDGQKLLDLILTASGKSNMVGTLTTNITTQADAIKKSIDGSSASFSTLKLTIGQVVAAAANTTSLEQLQVYLDGISTSGYNGAEGINALIQSFLDLGNVGAARVTGGLARKGLTTSQITTIIKAQNKGMDLDGTKSGKQLLKEAIDFNKKLSEVSKTGSGTTNPYKAQNDSLSNQNAIIDANIKTLEKKKKLIDDEIAAQKKITDELKRQHDFQASQADLESQIVDAKIHGNYLKAANLRQEMLNKKSEYEREGATTPQEDKSKAIQDQIDALKETKDANSSVINSNNTNSNNTTNTTNNYTRPGKDTGFDEGSFKNPIGTASLAQAYQNQPSLKPLPGEPGLDPSKWNSPLSAMFGPNSARSQIKKYAELQSIADGQFFTIDHNGLRYKFKKDDKKGNEGNIIMIGKPKKIVVNQPSSMIPGRAFGGLIKGPGTGMSDSIRATLGYAGGGSINVSNGEYIIKASSVESYGLSKMNAINSGTANVDTNSGGTVYNINMPITTSNPNPSIVADEVMRRLRVELNKNNKSNKVTQ